MLSKIKILNFQKHRKLKLQLSGLTTIVGLSDSGKSSVFRALMWSMLNRPSRGVVTTFGKNQTEIELTVDGQKVVRGKGKKTFWKIGDKQYKAMGAKVPEPIENLVAVDSINFASQHDQAFWFHLPAPQVAKSLNSIVDLNEIDAILKISATRVRGLKSQQTSALMHVDRANTELEELQWVPEFKTDLELLEKAAKRYKKTVERLEQVKAIDKKRKTIAKRIANQVEKEKDRKTIERIRYELEQVSKRIDLLRVYQAKKDCLKWAKSQSENEPPKNRASNKKRCPTCGKKL